MSFLGLAQAFFTGWICLGSYIFFLWIQFKGQELDKAVSLLALGLGFFGSGLAWAHFFFLLFWFSLWLLLLRGGPSHTYLLFGGGQFLQGQWLAQATSLLALVPSFFKVRIGPGTLIFLFWLGLLHLRDWSRPPYFCFQFWDYLVPGVQPGPVFLCFGPGFVWFKDYPRPIYLLGQGWPRNIDFLGLSQACFIRRICWGLLSLTFWALASSGSGLALGTLNFPGLAWPLSFEGLVQAHISSLWAQASLGSGIHKGPSLFLLSAWICLVQELAKAQISSWSGTGLLQDQNWPRHTHFLGLT